MRENLLKLTSYKSQVSLNRVREVDGLKRSKKEASAPAKTSRPALISTHPLKVRGVELVLRVNVALALASAARNTVADARPPKALTPRLNLGSK